MPAFKVVKPQPKTAAKNEKVQPVVEESAEYGATITLNPNAFRKFRFGVVKAKLILEHLAAIKEFVAAYDKPDTQDKE